jgi:hypothetical protein
MRASSKTKVKEYSLKPHGRTSWIIVYGHSFEQALSNYADPNQTAESIKIECISEIEYNVTLGFKNNIYNSRYYHIAEGNILHLLASLDKEKDPFQGPFTFKKLVKELLSI